MPQTQTSAPAKCASLLLLSLLLISISCFVHAAPDPELTYKLKASIAKVHVVTKSGGHGMGSGVVVAPDTVATNCHILANATGVSISKFGDSMTPVSMQADWAHDVCLLRFQYLGLTPVNLRGNEPLRYSEAVFSIGFPGGVIKPNTTAGKLVALYPMDSSAIIRTDAAFLMGASGSPLFDAKGRLIGLSTFKSPGKGAFYYHVPVAWIQHLLEQPQDAKTAETTPFWDLPLAQRPFFMQVVLPHQTAQWNQLEKIATAWIKQESTNAEAYFYLASALHGLEQFQQAKTHYETCLKLENRHIDAWLGLGMLAYQTKQEALLASAHAQLKLLNPDIETDLLDETIKALAESKE